ncbi:MAG TPA: PRC-barrel domain-containing protein [Burkholderiales bacterium]|nr:PRC-barrel domain-containing protein [Burkholderiales bacterium]
MKLKLFAVVILGSVLNAASLAYAAPTADAVAGTETIGISIEESKVAALGWSAEKRILHKAVYNDDNKKIGVIDDMIVSPERSISYAVIGVGGFLGMDRHNVLIPFSHLRTKGNKLVLPGATKAALKALPEFKYARQ